MGIWQIVKNFVAKIFWPWFIDTAWPLIKQHFEDLIDFLLRMINSEFKNWASERARNQSERAKEKSEEYDNKANSAKSAQEAEQYHEIAKVWREVAEQFRQENEDLLRKVNELSEKVRKEASDSVENLKLDLNFSDEKPRLMIGDTSYDLPALPSGDDARNSNT